MFKMLIHRIYHCGILMFEEEQEVYVPLRINTDDQYIYTARRNDRRLPVGHRVRGDVAV